MLFGDFRTALDEGEPRLYEDIQDYEAAQALFQEVIWQLLITLTLSATEGSYIP